MKRHSLSLLSTGAALVLASSSAQADQVIADDLIVQGSICAGFDCANGESFGFDTLRLKENNLRLHFNDTSASASFPSNDWRIVANDSSNGGASYLAFEDSTAGTKPFYVAAGAGNNALHVDGNGDVGVGTSNPVLELHIADGDSPSLRLEQNGSAGFTAQTWDIAGNETNFFVRDVTHSSHLPFRILANAADDSLVIKGNQIGLGTETPSASLHLRRTDGTARLRVEEASGTGAARTMAVFRNNGRPDVVLANTSQANEWSIGGGTNMVFKSGALDSAPSAKTTRLTLFSNGNATLSGTLTTGGSTCGGGCDLVFTEDYDLPSIDEHAERMYALGHLPNVGPTIENEPINVSDKLGRMLNELEHAHIYIDKLHDENQQQKAAIAALTARLDALEGATGE